MEEKDVFIIKKRKFRKDELIANLSRMPIDSKSIGEEARNLQICRAGMLAELDAINLYEQMAETTTNDDLRTILLDVAKEEKTHLGEFQTLLLKHDHEQVGEMDTARKEVMEKIKHGASHLIEKKPFKTPDLSPLEQCDTKLEKVETLLAIMREHVEEQQPSLMTKMTREWEDEIDYKAHFWFLLQMMEGIVREKDQ